MQDEDGILLEESNVVEKSNAILILVLDSYVVLINCILQPTTMEASSSLAQPDDTGMYNGWGPGYRNYRMGTSSKGIEASNSLLSDCTVSTSTHDYFCVDRAYSQNAAVSDRKAEIVLPQEYNFMRCLEDQSSYTCSRNDHQLDLDCSLTLGTPATKMHQKVRLPADFQKKLDWKQSPKANEGFATHVLFSEDAVHKDNRELYGQTSNDRLLPDLCLQVQSSRQEERIDWIDSRLRYNLEKASFDLQWNNPLKKVEGVMKFYDVQDRNCAQNCMKGRNVASANKLSLGLNIYTASNPTRPCGLRICSRCETTKTPLWRNGPQGPKSLCNACGIRYKKEERRAGNVAKNSEISSINNHPPRSNRKIVSLKQKNPIEWLLSAGNVMEEPGLLLPSAAKKTRVTYIHEKHKEIYRVDNHPNQMFLAQTKCSLVLASPSAL